MWKRYSIISLRGEVLDEGEGLGNIGHDGVEEPVVVGADIGQRLRIIFILRVVALRGSILTIFLVFDELFVGILVAHVCHR